MSDSETISSHCPNPNCPPESPTTPHPTGDSTISPDQHVGSATPANSAQPSQPSAESSNHTPSVNGQRCAIGFLTILTDVSGIIGGYLVTNSWGRPLEFRLSTAVQPNRVQQILYGPTLEEYLHAELIGKTLIEKTSTPADLVIVDTLPALKLREKFDIPVLALRPSEYTPIDDVVPVVHARSSSMMIFLAKYAADRGKILGILDAIDPAVDLSEPFSRIREAVIEARRTGGLNRVA